MLRSTNISLNFANIGKLNKLKEFIKEYSRVTNCYIDTLWEKQIFYGSFIDKETQKSVTTWLSCSMQQCAGKQALGIVKSQRKKVERTKPIFKGNSIDLDSRFIVIKNGDNLFDLWVRFTNIGKHDCFSVPSKKHKHFNKFSGWTLKKSTRLRIKEDGRLFLDFFFEKDKPEPKVGKTIGIDCGYKKLAVTSEGQFLGTELQQKAEKIAHKVQGSKAFKRALTERNQYIDQVVKQIDLTQVGTVVVENLKNVKSCSKGRISRKVMNKLQYWTYPKFLNRLNQRCEVVGVQWHTVNPSYTSRICEKCGDIHKENRIGELFRCTSCGYTTDADLNASRNILQKFLLQEFTDPVQKSCLCLSVDTEAIKINVGIGGWNCDTTTLA